LFGLTPIFLRYAQGDFYEGSSQLMGVLSSGDLFIISAVIAADLIGRVCRRYWDGPLPPARKPVFIGALLACLLLTVFPSNFYATTIEADHNHAIVSESNGYKSLWWFGATFVVGVITVAIVEACPRARKLVPELQSAATAAGASQHP
jgi:hypothetical protein